MSLYSYEGILEPLPPFKFSESLAFLSDFSPMKNEQNVKSSSFTKAVEINGITIAFEVADVGNVENPKVHFTAYSKSKPAEQIKALVSDRINFFLSLQDDLKQFYRLAKNDECFKPIIKRFYGHKQVKFLTPFEIACWAVLTQRTPMTFAHKMKEQIIQKFGGEIEVKGVLYQTFPEAPKLEAADNNELIKLIPNKRKVEYVSALSKAFNKVDEQWLRTAPFDDVYKWLTGIRGIGEWSAHFIMVRGLGRMEKLTSIESQLALDVAKIYEGKDEPVSEETVCKIADKFGTWQGYWAYYLRIYAEFAYVFEKGKKQLMQKNT